MITGVRGGGRGVNLKRTVMLLLLLLLLSLGVV
jgi:hypothetical protein